MLQIARGQRRRFGRLVMFGWARAIGRMSEHAYGLQFHRSAGHVYLASAFTQGRGAHLFSGRDTVFLKGKHRRNADLLFCRGVHLSFSWTAGAKVIFSTYEIW